MGDAGLMMWPLELLIGVLMSWLLVGVDSGHGRVFEMSWLQVALNTGCDMVVKEPIGVEWAQTWFLWVSMGFWHLSTLFFAYASCQLG